MNFCGVSRLSIIPKLCIAITTDPRQPDSNESGTLTGQFKISASIWRHTFERAKPPVAVTLAGSPTNARTAWKTVAMFMLIPSITARSISARVWI